MRGPPARVQDRTWHGRPGNSAEGRDEALIFAAHAAVALQSAQKDEHLRSAVLTRTTIGQAQGILLERHRITAGQAFNLLRELSQRRNIKLREVAHRSSRQPSIGGTLRRRDPLPARRCRPNRCPGVSHARRSSTAVLGGSRWSHAFMLRR